MKIKKTKITYKNINMVYGLIKKFFSSIKSGEDYECEKWQKKIGYSYPFEKSLFWLSDNEINFEYPIRLSISINDTIHLDGNYLIVQKPMRQYDNSIYYYYRTYKRIKNNFDK